MIDPRKSLSPRQAECLRRVRALQSTGEIARDLNISTGTVNGYIKDAIVTLGARDRRHAALIFAEMDDADADAPPPSSPPPPPQVAPVVRSTVQDAGAYLPPLAAADHGRLGAVLREIASGSRPEGWSMMTRAVLILAAVVIAGFSVLAMSAALGALHGLAAALRGATG